MSALDTLLDSLELCESLDDVIKLENQFNDAGLILNESTTGLVLENPQTRSTMDLDGDSLRHRIFQFVTLNSSDQPITEAVVGRIKRFMHKSPEEQYESLVNTLANWKTTGFISPDRANSFYNRVRILARRSNRSFDELYAKISADADINNEEPIDEDVKLIVQDLSRGMDFPQDKMISEIAENM